MLAGGLKLSALVWLYTDTVTVPGLSPGSVPDRLFWFVGNGTVSVVPPPVSAVARTCPNSTPLRVKFTTGKPKPASAKPPPVSVKLSGAAPRSTGLGVIAVTQTVPPLTVRLMLAGGLKLLALVWLYTDTVTVPGRSPGSVPDRLFWFVGNGTVSVVPPPVSAVARTCPSSTPSLPRKFTTGKPKPASAKPPPVSVKLPGAAPRSIGLGVMALTPTKAAHENVSGVIVSDHALIVPTSCDARSITLSVQLPLPALLSKPESGYAGLKLA